MNVVGLGSDLVEVERIRRALERQPRLMERLFTPGEIEYASARRDPAKSLAARFGAKEAVMKACGVGIGAFAFTECEVVRDGEGAPSIVLHGRAAELAEELGVRAWQLSLTHTESIAMAVAVALG
jgi:holo-[acyl-carrier protein] synthase